jgi:hypothetical protein
MDRVQVFVAGAGAKQKDLISTANISRKKQIERPEAKSFLFCGVRQLYGGSLVRLGKPGAYVGHIACKDGDLSAPAVARRSRGSIATPPMSLH